MRGKIELKTNLKCPECNEEVTIEQIDTYTFSQSLTREQRRRYKSMVDVWNRQVKNKKMCYCCPMCERWSRVDVWSAYNREENTEKREPNTNKREQDIFTRENNIGKMEQDIDDTDSFSIVGLSDE